MERFRTAFVHYTAPPVIGGVEAVLYAHAQAFQHAGYPVTVVAGQGQKSALPAGTDFIHIPRMDTQHPEILSVSSELEKGKVPEAFEQLTEHLVKELKPILSEFDAVIVHNVFTKHFNLPLTAALDRLLNLNQVHHCISWCHDLTWTSEHSRERVHAGYPWDLLRNFRPDVIYVAISERRKQEMLKLYQCPPQSIKVIYNGVNPKTLLGLSEEGEQLAERLGLWDCDLILLMPVRVTHAKNIEYALRVTASMKSTGLRTKMVLTGPPDPHDAKSMQYFRELQELRKELDVEDEFRFVFESGPNEDKPYIIGQKLVGELYRLSDFLFMPSHREGFGMPVLEAGLVGVPVISTDIPAAIEIGGENVLPFSPTTDPDFLAEQIVIWVEESPIHQLRKRVRQNYTWQRIFEQEIRPLLLKVNQNGSISTRS